MTRTSPLFQRFPLSGPSRTSAGNVPTPYHIYDGYGVFIGGTVDLAATRSLLSNQSVSPIEVSANHTWMGIWVCNFTDASLGPHHELQFSFFVNKAGTAKVSSHPLSLLAALARSELQMLCHGLWNSTPLAVAYNRELLSLNAHLSDSQIAIRRKLLKFDVCDPQGRAILAGTLPNAGGISLRPTWDLARQIGLRRTWLLSRQPWMELQILNPVGLGLSENAVAETYTKNDKTLITYFNDHRDRIEFGDTPYSRLNFQPQFIQYMKGFRFVYLHPQPGTRITARPMATTVPA